MAEFVRQHPKYDHNNHISEFYMRSFMVQAIPPKKHPRFGNKIFQLTELYTLISDFECNRTF